MWDAIGVEQHLGVRGTQYQYIKKEFWIVILKKSIFLNYIFFNNENFSGLDL